MFERIKEIIIKAIEKVFEESEYDFDNWYKSNFETEYGVDSLEELLELSKEELENLKSDWIQYIVDGFATETYSKLGIEMPIKNKYHKVLIVEIYELIKEQLWEKLNKKIYCEIEFGKKKELEDDTFIGRPDREFICFILEVFPTIEEAEHICKETMEALGYDTICGVTEISYHEAQERHAIEEI